MCLFMQEKTRSCVNKNCFNLCYTLTNHKNRDIKKYIYLYFHVYLLMTAAFTHSKNIFFFFQKEKSLISFVILQIEQQTIIMHLFFLLCNNNHWNLEHEACVRTFRGAEDSMKMRQRNVGESASENLIKATSAAGNADSLMPVQRPQRD